jgi:ribose/xylose/arabinose/galactoside ABC-type transport system permease subunit
MSLSQTINNGHLTEREAAERAERRRRLGTLYRRYGILAILAVEMLLWTILSPAFLTPSNMINVLRQASFVGVVAAGQTFVILTAGIDLSVGGVVAFGGMMAAMAMESGSSAMIGAFAALATGIGIGYINGFVSTKMKIPAFITTLAMMTMLKAVALLLRGGSPIAIRNTQYVQFGQGYIGSIPIPVVVLALTYLIGHWILWNTKFGQHIYAVGGNEAAARLAGIRVARVISLMYVICGGLAGLAAVMISGRLETGTPLAGTNLELDCIAAVIVGGTSLFGGQGTMWGTLAGVMIISFMRNGLTLVGVSGFWQQFATGAIILGAVLLDHFVSARDRQ